MDPVVAQCFEDILSDPIEIAHGLDVFTKSVNRIRAEVLNRRIKDIQRRIESTHVEDEKVALLTEKVELTDEVRALDPTILDKQDPQPGRPNLNEPST